MYKEMLLLLIVSNSVSLTNLLLHYLLYCRFGVWDRGDFDYPMACCVVGSVFEIVEIADIEREYLLVDARLRLLARDHDDHLAVGKHTVPV